MPDRRRGGIRNRQARKGMILIATALCIIAMIAVVGLAVDLGRMYIAKNETQNFVDSASLAATLELDGTWAGIDRARAGGGKSEPLELQYRSVSGPGDGLCQGTRGALRSDSSESAWV